MPEQRQQQQQEKGKQQYHDIVAQSAEYRMFEDRGEAENWVRDTQYLDDIWREYEESGAARRQPGQERRAA